MVEEQASLVGLEPADARPTSRLFIAVFPDPDTAERIAEVDRRLRTRHGLQGASVPAERLHLTLHHLGDHAGMRLDIVAAAIKAAASVDMPTFDVVLDRVTSFDSRSRHRPLVLRAAETTDPALKDLQRTLGNALQKTFFGRQIKTSFTPHVTLGYDRILVPEQPLGEEPIRWRASEFVLVHSLIGKSLYVPLSRWSLRGGA